MYDFFKLVGWSEARAECYLVKSKVKLMSAIQQVIRPLPGEKP